MLRTFSHRKYIAFFTIIFSLCSSYAIAATAPKRTCASSVEKEALDVRVLQTELMFAALNCNEKDNYNQFVKKFQPELQKNSTAMQNYFKNNYKKNSTAQLNQFVTQLANGVADRSAHTRPSTFCAGARSLFIEALQHTDSSLPKLASQQRFASQHGVTDCPSKKPAKASTKVVTK